MKLQICAVAITVSLAATGCATKKYVRNTIAPIERRVAGLDGKTTDHDGSIGELEKGVSLADERALSAGSRADAAAREAAKANEQAALANRGVGEAKASRGAGEARSLAERGQNRTAEVARTLGTRIENIDNYKLVGSEDVLFAFGRSDLSKEAQELLDAAVQKVSSMKHYVIEVQGFTDKTGPSRYNLELSRRRAASVVRYLTITHKLPLHRIYTMGYGSDRPTADNSTREGRMQNRRVELKFFAADLGAVQTSSSPGNR
jgi:outer membrane protein OmpA-like peptidoglycan-associated protein